MSLRRSQVQYLPDRRRKLLVGQDRQYVDLYFFLEYDVQIEGRSQTDKAWAFQYSFFKKDL